MSPAHTTRRRWRGHISRRVRVGVLLALAICSAAAYLVGEHLSVSKEVELNVTADQGKATIAIAADANGISPGCGCLEPAFGKEPWSGLSLPSLGFDLDVDAKPSREVAADEWQMTAMAPALDTIDWFAAPDQTVDLRVTVVRGEHHVQFFAGRTTFLDVITSRAIDVEQDQRYPYAALLPADGGATTVQSESPSRPQDGGSMTIASTAPAQGWAIPPRDGNYLNNVSLTHHGPMIDVIGRTVTFRLDELSTRRYMRASNAS